MSDRLGRLSTRETDARVTYVVAPSFRKLASPVRMLASGTSTFERRGSVPLGPPTRSSMFRRDRKDAPFRILHPPHNFTSLL